MPHVSLRDCRCLAGLLAASLGLIAGEHRGVVRIGGTAVPGAQVVLSRDGRKAAAMTNLKGEYTVAGIEDGIWLGRVEMRGFVPLEGEVRVGANQETSVWSLEMLPLAAIVGKSAPLVVTSPAAVAADPGNAGTADEPSSMPADLLINGSVNNGAASPFGQSAAFGNHRSTLRAAYNGSLGLIAGHSALDARPFSLTGQETPMPAYSHWKGMAAFGGPLRIPHLLWQNGPNFTVNYQWFRDRNAGVQAARVPSQAERRGDLSGAAGQPFDPDSAAPFPGGVIPASRLSPQAQSLLRLYPEANSTSGAQYNFQTLTPGGTQEDAWQSRFTQPVNRSNQLVGSFSGQSTRAAASNLFGFQDGTGTLGLNAGAAWRHLVSTRLSLVAGYQYSRLSNRVTPFFAGRSNVSGEAGLSGNNQDAVNWGPPALNFSGATPSLADANASFTRNQTSGASFSGLWNRERHNFAFGGDLRRQQFNLLAQQDARGTFSFTGAAAGSDLAGFLLGLPDTSSIAFGNGDKYLRAGMYDWFITDDFRVSPGFTLNIGVRWDYGSPITEKYGRLVNLDLSPGFGAGAPVLASRPVGPLTGRQFRDSLLRPDYAGLQPRLGLSWRPIAASSLVIRAGYGIYDNTAVYLPIASGLSQQPPLSRNFSVQSTPSAPLTLADGFHAPARAASNTYAADPDLRVGYAQVWSVALQRDLPAGLAMTAAYRGVKGTRGLQQILPNTVPARAASSCPGCPVGFVYLESNGNSSRHAGQFELRRRFHDGLTAQLQYVYSKSIDNSGLAGGPQGGQSIAQNWLDLKSERGLSSFDQRHLVNLAGQYTTGMRKRRAAWLPAWGDALANDWNVAAQLSAGSGLPQTPIYFAAVQGTGVTGSLRPDFTGIPATPAPPGLFLNPYSFRMPAVGRWGNAGRNSITGPAQFSLNASLGRTFRVGERLSLDLRIEAMNALNHVTFTGWNTTATSPQFGLPLAANPMRAVQTTLRFRF